MLSSYGTPTPPPSQPAYGTHLGGVIISNLGVEGGHQHERGGHDLLDAISAPRSGVAWRKIRDHRTRRYELTPDKLPTPPTTHGGGEYVALPSTAELYVPGFPMWPGIWVPNRNRWTLSAAQPKKAYPFIEIHSTAVVLYAY